MRISRSAALAAITAFLLGGVAAGLTSAPAPGVDLSATAVPDAPPGLVVTVAEDARPEEVARDLEDLDTVTDAEAFGSRYVRVAPYQPPASLRGVRGVEAVEDDVWAVLAEDPRIAEQWHLRNEGGMYWDGEGSWRDAVVGADIGWDAARPISEGDGVVVAVVDTGVQLDHPDLAARIWQNPDEVAGNGVDDDGNGKVDDASGWDFASSDADPGHEAGDTPPEHGTHIAGTIAAVAGNDAGGAGVAPSATILPVRVANEGGAFSMALASEAINYAVAEGADVVNASFGTSDKGIALPSYLDDALNRARDAGVIVVASAGNDALDLDVDANRTWPAAASHDNVLTVGASTQGDRRAFFSNYGANRVDVFAPGLWIDATLPSSDYGSKSGTSMAAPVAAGAAALLAANDPTRSPADIVAQLKATAVRPIELAGTSQSGRISAAAALGVVGATSDLALTATGVEGLRADSDAPLTVSVATDVPLPAAARLRGTLATRMNGETYAVTGHELDVDGRAATTDANAEFELADAFTGASVTLAVTTRLPQGSHALLVEALDGDGEVVTTGPPAVLLFAVGPAEDAPPDEPTPEPTLTASPAPSPSDAPEPSPEQTPAPEPGADPTPDPAPGPDPSPTAAPPPQPTPEPTSTPEPEPEPTPPSPELNPEPAPTAAPEPEPTTEPSAPPTTSPSPSPSPSPDPAPDEAVWHLSPMRGTVGDLVRISRRDLPENLYVHFDGVNAPIVSRAGDTVWVEAPPHVPARVDVTVLDGAGWSELVGSFTYVNPLTPSGPEPEPEPSSDPTPEPSPDGRTVGSPFRSPSGLTLDRFVSGHALASVPASAWASACVADPCVAYRL